MKYKKVYFWILLFLIPISFAFVVWTVASSFINADLSGSTTRWEKLPAPPEEVLQLIGVDSIALVVKTINDEIYGANLYTCFETTKDCWQAIVPGEPISPPRFVNCWHEFKVIDPPSNTTQRIDNCEGGSGGVLRTNAVLLSDGSILIWNDVIYDLSGLAFIMVPVYAFFGLIFGVFISMFLASRYKRKYGDLSS